MLRVDVENGLETGSTPEVPPLKAAPEPAPAPVVGHAPSAMPAANVPASEPFPLPLPPQPVPGPFAAGHFPGVQPVFPARHEEPSVGTKPGRLRIAVVAHVLKLVRAGEAVGLPAPEPVRRPLHQRRCG